MRSLAKEGFAGNVVGYACIRRIAEAAASVPLLTYSNGNETETHPLKTLLAAPNPSQTGRELLEHLYAHLMVAGNAYAELVTLTGTPANYSHSARTAWQLCRHARVGLRLTNTPYTDQP